MTFQSWPLITPTTHPPVLNYSTSDPADLKTSKLNKLSVTILISLKFRSRTFVTTINWVRDLIAGDLTARMSSVFPALSADTSPFPLQHLSPFFPLPKTGRTISSCSGRHLLIAPHFGLWPFWSCPHMLRPFCSNPTATHLPVCHTAPEAVTETLLTWQTWCLSTVPIHSFLCPY